VAVQVKDPGGNPVVGATVTFQITGGGGSISGTTAGTITVSTNTDASGIARTNWILGTGVGIINTMNVTVVNGPSTSLQVTTQ
jgi:hypothetical protein